MGNSTFDALAYLGERWAKQRPLSEFADFLHALGNPQRKLRCIQVAGTNGKGSTCAYIESILRHNGCSTALFTSPALQRVNERFVINGNVVDDESLFEAAQRVYQTEKKLKLRLSGFDRMTATAMLLFSEAGIEFAVLEAGMGGRLDATTACGSEIAVITSIGLDHTEYLGNTVEAIAAEKSAIIRAGQRCVIVHPQEIGVMRVIEARCAEMDLPMIRVDSVITNRTFFDESRQEFELQYGGVKYIYRSRLLGRYQVQNAVAAIILSRVLEIDAIDVREGIENTRWPGRLEFFPASDELKPISVPLLLDGAHNPHCMAELANSINEHFGGKRFIMITGFMADKEWRDMLTIISEHVAATIALDIGERGVAADEIVKAMHSIGGSAETAPSIEAAFDRAQEICEEPMFHDCYILVCGSLYLVGDVRKYISAGTEL